MRILSRQDRDAVRSASPADAGAHARLAAELAAATSRSLGALALCVAFVMVGMGLVGLVGGPALAPAAPRAASQAVAVSTALSLLLFLVSRSGLVSPARLLDLGAAYQVLQGLLTGIHFHSVTHGSAPLVGWSPVAVWVVIYPSIVPAGTGRVVVGSLLTAATEPLARAFAAPAGATPAPLSAAYLASYALALVLAPVTSRIAYGLACELVAARDLGRYELVQRLGAGGMGEVWKGRHRMLARSAAIKLIRPELIGAVRPKEARQLVKRFEREARATAAMRSPHTIEIYDFGTTRDGAFFIAVELLPGYNWETLVRRFGPVPPERAVFLLRQACRSLAEAHASGLVHRDVKPANLYVSLLGLEPDFVKVLDFGLVKDSGPPHQDRPAAGDASVSGADALLTQTRTIVGTPAYLAPEVALGQGEIDGRADLYGLGCVAYWLVTGQQVFTAASPMQLIVEHVRTAPVPPSQRAAQAIPASFEALVLRCLAKDPKDRPQSARELLSELEALELPAAWDEERAREWWASHPHNVDMADELSLPSLPTLSADRRP